MLKVYVREGFLYSKKELFEILAFDSGDDKERKAFGNLVDELKRKRLLKTRRKKGSRENKDDDASLMSEDDIDFDDYVGDEKEGTQYIFKFVGTIFHKDRIINVYPKYIVSGEELTSKMRQIIKVIRKHQGKMYRLDVSAILEQYDSGEEVTELSIILFLIADYAENGLYYQNEKINEVNGDGEVHWGRTVERFDPLFINGRPMYVDLLTTRTIDNALNYFVRLHKYILTRASNELVSTDLSAMFGLPVIELSDEDISDFGDVDYILSSIDSEMGRQFEDRKLAVLRAMYMFVKKLQDEDPLHMNSGGMDLRFFGTRAFHKVWEDVIDEVYVSQKNITFGEIKKKYVKSLDYMVSLPNGSTMTIQASNNLGEVIEKPEWYIKEADGAGALVKHLPSSTFIPDYLRFNEARDTFYIIDAKYYLPRCYLNNEGEWRIEKQPGVEDVVKQYMYYMAYRPLLKKNNIDVKHVENYYLMPTEGEDEDIGFAKIDFFAELIPDVFNIKIKKINARSLFECYLRGEERAISSLPR